MSSYNVKVVIWLVIDDVENSEKAGQEAIARVQLDPHELLKYADVEQVKKL